MFKMFSHNKLFSILTFHIMGNLFNETMLQKEVETGRSSHLQG